MPGSPDEDGGRIQRTLIATVDKATALQAPAVAKYVAKVRRAHPDENPEQIIRRMENRFLTLVTSSGAAVGATAAVPSVGTGAALIAAGGESALFIEASALLTLAIATVHGVHVTNREHRRALVLAIILGNSGTKIVETAMGHRGGVGTFLTSRIPKPTMNALNKTLLRKFASRFATKKGVLTIGTLAPAGIGAFIGATGNRVMGKTVIRSARTAFGLPPQQWLDTIDQLDGFDAKPADRRSPEAPTTVTGLTSQPNSRPT